MSLPIAEIRKKIFFNSGLIVVGRFLGTISSLLIIPMNIHKLGIDGYGQWGAIWAEATFFSVFNMALASTMLWQSSTVEEEGVSPDEYTQVIRHRAGIGVFFVLIQFLLCGIVVLLLQDLLTTKIGLTASPLNRLCLVGSIGLVLLSGYNEIVGSILSGQHFSGVVSNMRSISALLGNLITFILLVAGWGLISLPLGFAGNYLLFFLMLVLWSGRKLGIIFFMPRIPGWSELKLLTGYTVCGLVGRITAAIRTQFTCIALGTQVSFEWAGYYTIALKISALLLEVNGFFMIPMIAFINKLKKEKEALSVIYRDMVVAAAVVSGIVFTGIIAAGADFLRLWLNSPNLKMLLPMISILLLQYMIALIITGQGVAVCQGDGKIHFETAYLLLNLVLNIVFLMTTKSLGGWGILLSAAMSWILAGICFSYFVQKHYHLPSTFPICMKTLAGSLIIMWSVLWMTWTGITLFANPWIGMIVKGIVGEGIFLLVLFPCLRVVPLRVQRKYLSRAADFVRTRLLQKVNS